MKKILFIGLFIGLLTVVGCSIGKNTTLRMTLQPGIDTIEINGDYVDPGAKATFGLLNVEVTVASSDLGISALGTYSIVYEASYGDQTKTISRYVTVIDDTAPQLSLNPGIDTILIGETWIDGGVTVIDNSLSSIVPTVIGQVNEQIVGDYEITYRATDASGNQNQITRIVHVIDDNE